MKTKKILRFYFSADSLESAFDNLILKKACAPYAAGLENAEKLCSIIDEKIQLGNLWEYLDGILSEFTKGERETLLNYSSRCTSLKSDCNEVKRTVIKFTRRARRLSEFESCFSVLNKYYCLIK